MMPREIERLRAIGYSVSIVNHRGIFSASGYQGLSDGFFKTAHEAWDHCKEHAQSPEGLKATMAAKVEWLRSQDLNIYFSSDKTMAWDDARKRCYSVPDLDEGGADAIFWTVP